MKPRAYVARLWRTEQPDVYLVVRTAQIAVADGRFALELVKTLEQAGLATRPRAIDAVIDAMASSQLPDLVVDAIATDLGLEIEYTPDRWAKPSTA